MSFTDAFHKWIKDPGSKVLSDWIRREEEFLRKNVQKGRILDIGVGNGRVLKLLEDRGDLFGVDTDAKMVSIAKDNVPYAHIELGDARFLPFRSDFFDYVLCVNNTLGNIPIGKIRVLKEMNRVLRPGGTAILSVYADTEITLEERLRSYRYVGLKPKVVGGFIVIADELYSEQFSEQRLKTLLKAAHVKNYEIYSLAKIGLVAVWKKI